MRAESQCHSEDGQHRRISLHKPLQVCGGQRKNSSNIQTKPTSVKDPNENDFDHWQQYVENQQTFDSFEYHLKFPRIVLFELSSFAIGGAEVVSQRFARALLEVPEHIKIALQIV